MPPRFWIAMVANIKAPHNLVNHRKLLLIIDGRIYSTSCVKKKKWITNMFPNLIENFLHIFTNILAQNAKRVWPRRVAVPLVPCGNAGVWTEDWVPGHSKVDRISRASAALMMAPGFERLRDSELRRQSGNKWGKCILRTALLLRCQRIWWNLWFRLKSPTSPILSH